MSLVSNIQFLCEEIGISIPKLERKLGFGKGSMYKWDKNSPSIDKLEKVANHLKVSVDYLLDRGDVFDLGPYIQEEREFQGLTEKELSDQIGISEFELSQYEDCIIPLTEDLVNKIMTILGLSFPEFLNKYGLFDMEIPSHFDGDVDKFLAFKKAEEQDALSENRDVQVLSAQFIEFDSEYLRRIPLVGRAAAGNPMSAIENPGEYVVIDTRINKVNGTDINEFYALEVVGQSMEPTIHDGEIVMVRKQPVIEPGQIGVFRCNGDEATIKRLTQEGVKVYLIPDNKQFPVQEYTTECECVGKVMESIRRAIK